MLSLIIIAEAFGGLAIGWLCEDIRLRWMTEKSTAGPDSDTPG